MMSQLHDLLVMLSTLFGVASLQRLHSVRLPLREHSVER